MIEINIHLWGESPTGKLVPNTLKTGVTRKAQYGTISEAYEDTDCLISGMPELHTIFLGCSRIYFEFSCYDKKYAIWTLLSNDGGVEVKNWLTPENLKFQLRDTVYSQLRNGEEKYVEEVKRIKEERKQKGKVNSSNGE